MGRLKFAWLALTKGLQVVHVPGEAMTCRVYSVMWIKSQCYPSGVGRTREFAYFADSKSAHDFAADKSSHVLAINAIRTPGGYFLPSERLIPITVEAA